MAADKLISSGSPWKASIGHSRATVGDDYVHVSGSTASVGVTMIDPRMLVEIEVDTRRRS